MSSLALHEKNGITTEISSVNSCDAVTSSFPIDRMALERLLKEWKAQDASFTENRKINISNRNLNNADLRGFSLIDFDITGCSFEEALFDRISLESILPAAREGKISLRRANFTGINLEAKYVSRPDLGLSSYVPLDMRGLDLRDTIFASANLKRLILTDANLTGANFSGADLSNVSAKNANFQYASFKNATLSGGDFRDCDFRGATFTGARI